MLQVGTLHVYMQIEYNDRSTIRDRAPRNIHLTQLASCIDKCLLADSEFYIEE